MKEKLRILGFTFSFFLFSWMTVYSQSVATLRVESTEGQPQISRFIYGMFSEDLGHGIYNGFWVGEDSPIPNKDGLRLDLVDAFKKINIPVLRWPGGCFADDYHWRDGIGPKSQRKAIVNEDWGQVPDNNHFGTDEFMELCELLETEPYFAGNV